MDTYGKRLYAALITVKPDLVPAKQERKWLAEKLGVSVQALGQVINSASSTLSVINHEKAVEVLGCSGKWLATGVGQMFGGTKGDWPFSLIGPMQYKQLSDDFKHDTENKIAGEWMRTQQANASQR